MTREAELPFGTRLWFAFVCFFKVLFDGTFAQRAFAAQEAPKELPAKKTKGDPTREEATLKTRPLAPTKRETPIAKSSGEHAITIPSNAPALSLLALLQREGRLIDFLEQDVASFEDADIGAAVRVVHEGCRKALRSAMKLEPIRSEEEGANITLDEGFDAKSIKLTGDVKGAAPWKGVLKHRGWRAKDVKLPTPVKEHDATVLAPAEVEL